MSAFSNALKCSASRLTLRSSSLGSAACTRSFSSGARSGGISPQFSSRYRIGSLLAGTAVLYGGYRLATHDKTTTTAAATQLKLFPVVDAASSQVKVHPQPSVISETKQHALYLWIHLKPEANVKQCAKAAASLPDKIKVVCPPDDTDDDDEILGGVGFGYNFYKQATGNKAVTANYNYPHRKGYNGDMPSTGGDIFIHAKSNSRSKLYELSKAVLKSFPNGSIDKAEDLYGWVYKNGRDLSGFIDGTENPAEEDDRFKVAVNDKSGDSYAITQKWVHKFNVIDSEKDSVLESWIGRTLSDSTELTKKKASAHVARMVGTTTPGQKKPFEIVRQSQPYGTVCGDSGLFFIAYAASPDNLEYMLDRMVGADPDGLSDDVMLLSKIISGNYWYFPSQDSLQKLK